MGLGCLVLVRRELELACEGHNSESYPRVSVSLHTKKAAGKSRVKGCPGLSRSRCSETCFIKGAQSAAEGEEPIYDQTCTRMTSLWTCVSWGAHVALRTSQQSKAPKHLLYGQSSLARILPCCLHQLCFCRFLTTSQAKCLLLGSTHTAQGMEMLPPKLETLKRCFF